MIIASIAVSIFIFFSPSKNNPVFKNLYFLPLATGFLMLLPCSETTNLAKYITYIVESGIIIRNVVATLMLVLSNYAATISYLSKASMDAAIFLLILETFCILVVLSRKTHTVSQLKEIYGLSTQELKISIGRFYWLILLTLSLICIICLFWDYNIVSYYTLSWRVSDKTARIVKHADILFTVFSFCFEIVKMMIIVLGFKLLGQKRNSLFKVLMIILIIGLPAFFSIENYGYILINILVSTVFAMTVFPKQKVQVFGLSLVIGVSLFFIFFSVKLIGPTLGNSTSGRISVFLQAYFGGITNVAGAMKLDNIDKLKSLFYDIYFMIPFRNTLFGITGDMRSTQFFNYVNRVNSQIIPCISQGFLYIKFFSVFLTSALIGSAYSIIVKMGNKICKGSDYIRLFISIYFALTPFMYNFTILGSWVLMVFLPALLVFSLSGRFTGTNYYR
jgi:hypothetical protein